ncbi:MAG: HAD-IA family hydrolase [Dehalococcoidia bacterium]
MAPGTVLFIDDGGVMNDNAVRGPQWQRLVGEFLTPILGGSSAAWGEANRVVATRLWTEYQRTTGGRTNFDFRSWLDGYRVAWTREMCEHVGVAAPSAEDCARLAEGTRDYVTIRVRSALPGVIDAIHLLRRRGYALHAASGEESGDLHGYLTGMGVRRCFGRLYGPDLINTPKEGPAYYERAFADAGVAPADAVVVDDNPLAISWAAAAGARTVLVHGDGAHDGVAGPRVTDLCQLPAALDEL